MPNDKDLKTRLEEELTRAYAQDLRPPGLEDPAWLPSVEQRDNAERAEAAQLLNKWLALDAPPEVLRGREATETVIGTCGASRGFLERLLTDAEYQNPYLLVRD